MGRYIVNNNNNLIMNRNEFQVIEIDLHRIASLKPKHIEMSQEVMRWEIRNGVIDTIISITHSSLNRNPS